MATAAAILDQVCNRATCPQCGFVATATDRCRCLRVKQAGKLSGLLKNIIGPGAAGLAAGGADYAATGDLSEAATLGLGTAFAAHPSTMRAFKAKGLQANQYAVDKGLMTPAQAQRQGLMTNYPRLAMGKALIPIGFAAARSAGDASQAVKDVQQTTGNVNQLVQEFRGGQGDESPMEALRKGVTAVGKAGETAAGQAKQIGANVEGASQQVATAAGDLPKMTGTMAHTAKVVDQTAQEGRGLAKTVNDTLPQLTAMGERATSALDSIGGEFGKFREGLESAGNWVKDRAPYFAAGGLGVTGLYAASAWWQAKKEEEKRQRLKMILSGAHIN